jgi:dolichol-phosphate mannosyltransferase
LKAVIILPTYNERENIKAIVMALLDQFSRLRHDAHILVVDDNSPDGTGDVVKTLQAEYDNVHLLSGERAGLGTAYIRGMCHALDALQADLVIEMDADFSHKPEDVARLLSEIEAGEDFVIGSRYVEGGTISSEWGRLRRYISRGGNMAARHIAGMSQIRDCTAGFRAIRASLLRRIKLEGLRTQGYAFQVALLHAAIEEGGKIREIPVDFVNRKYGKSKLGFSDVMEFMMNVWWIRLQSVKAFIKSVIVAASGILVNLGSFTLLLQVGMNKYIASPIAIGLSIAWIILVKNYRTFRLSETNTWMHIRNLKFNLVSIIGMMVSYGTFVALSLAFPDIAPQINQLIGVVPAMLVNYSLNNYWTFRRLEG